MKILFVTQNFYPELGSAANRMRVMFKLFNQNSYEASIITTNPTYPTKILFNEKIYFNDEYINNLENNKVIRLKTKTSKLRKNLYSRLFYFMEEFIQLRMYLASNARSYDFIYVSSPNIFMAWATLFFKKRKVNYILEIRDLWPDSVNQIQGINIKKFMPMLKFLEKRMYNKADKIVINNLSFKNHISSKLKSNIPIFYLPNGIQVNEISNIEKHDSFTAIYTGNVGHAQDVKKLIEITHRLNDLNIPLIAIIYGAKASEFREAVKNLDKVIFKQPMPREECLKEISKAHISLSLLESADVFLNVLPGKIVDSISMGTIPVTNLGGYTKNIINDNKLGIAQENADIEFLISEIIKLKSNIKIQKEMQNNTINYRNQNLIWENNINKLDEFLQVGGNLD